MEAKKHLLFICSGNVDRSPTAEDMFKDSNYYEARSAGTHPLATKKVGQELIDWADTIFVMSEKEDKHLTFLKQNFKLAGKKCFDLDIPDMYERGDSELVARLEEAIAKHLPKNTLPFGEYEEN